MKNKTQVQSEQEKLFLGMKPQELTYPIQATAGGLVPSFSDDVSPVWTAAFVEATTDLTVLDAGKT